MTLPDLSTLTAIAVPAIGGILAYGKLQQRVNAVEKDIEKKAEKEVVDVHFNAVVERLERIERKLDRQTGAQ